MSNALQLFALGGLPLIEPGDDLASLLVGAASQVADGMRDADVLVVAQKIVSKAEGRYLDLQTVQPSAEALDVAARTGKEPRFVEAVLRESVAVLRAARNVLITRHRLGYVMANAGIDRSNLRHPSGSDLVLLLPIDPDRTARDLRDAIRAATGHLIGVVVSDSFGRPWRVGTVNVALGVAGMPSLLDLRGGQDRHGRRLETTQIAFADAVAAAAGIAMGEAAESTPAVLVRGLHWSAPDCDSRALIRPVAEDLFL